jgi:hypothetical protein
VGGPETVPFEFQYDLGIQYRVGRLPFDSPDEYRNYAESVASIETSGYRASRRPAFFSPRHEGDDATRTAVDHLTVPLIESTSLAFPDWNLRGVVGPQATKLELLTLLKGEDRPDFIFAVAHGVVFKPDHKLQVTNQGSLLCADMCGRARS